MVFVNEENGWCVVRLTVEGERRPVTAVGNLLGAQPGEALRLTGRWVDDKRYGRQFEVESFLAVEPSTAEGLRRFLGSGLIHGIGPAMARRLVEHFGLDCLDVIETEPERLEEVDGIGPVRARRIRTAYLEQRELRDAMIFLQGHGVTPRLAVRICQLYGDQTVAVVRQNPFRLASEMFGVGFKTADTIASQLGFAETSPERIRAGLAHTLDRAADDGHVYLPEERLVADSAELLGVAKALSRGALEELLADGELIAESEPREDGGPQAEHAVYAPELYRAEVGIAASIERLLGARRDDPDIRVERAIEWFERRVGFELAERQREAIRRGLADPLVIVTGGPGTGKTTLVHALTEILSAKRQRLALAAPTGRAANRLGEATGREAKTIHRLLEYDPHRHGFLRGPERPLELDVLIVDEVSMLDTPLTHLLLGAIPSGARLVLLGDADQLPSVGPGRVLDELISSRRLPVVHLSEIFRQARSSRIVLNAHRVNRGQLPDLDGDTSEGELGRTSDFFFIERHEPEAILAVVCHLVTERIPAHFGFDPMRDIQVLTPMRRGLLGTNHLNQELQRRLNSSERRIRRGSTVLAEGDRVMQVRNNYELGVFNGDIGRILSIDTDEEVASIEFNDRPIEYGAVELEEITLAYACSVHKSQGSEYPCVVLPLHSQHHVMLERNLLYTALTRAKRLAVVVGTRQAVRTAVRNHRPRRRFTRLARRLAAAIEPPEAAGEPS